MADPLSVSVSVAEVANSAYQSCKALNETIGGFINAPKIFQDLRRDLVALQSLLDSLQGALHDVPNAALSVNQRNCFEELKPAMRGCQAICDDFVQKLSKIANHSDTERVNWGDRVRLHFNEKDAILLKGRLGDYTQTFDVALGVAPVKDMGKNQGTLQDLETQITTSLSGFTGQIHGLDIALQSLSLPELTISKKDVDVVVGVLNDHDGMLKQCLKVCTSALAETNWKGAGTSIKYARTFEEARQFIGNMGDIGQSGPLTQLEYAEASGKSRQVVGNMSADVARDFFC